MPLAPHQSLVPHQSIDDITLPADLAGGEALDIGVIQDSYTEDEVSDLISRAGQFY